METICRLVEGRGLKLHKSFSYCDLAVLAGLLLLLPLSAYLPKETGWENGFFENAQVVVLVVGAVMAATWDLGRFSKLGKAVSATFLLMGCRELSWGRVFMTPTLITDMGPKFPPMKTLPLYPVVYFLIGLTLVGIVRTLWKNFSLAAFRSVPVPLTSCLVGASCMLLHFVAEHYNVGIFIGPRGQIIEEAAEIGVYLEMIYMCCYYKQQLKSTNP